MKGQNVKGQNVKGQNVKANNLGASINARKLAHHISKESTLSEQCLNVHNYSIILYEIFRSAEGEFAFGLFGRWGRGKTNLIKNASSIFEKVGGYSVVYFNAWKYRQSPELWVHLYETFYNKSKEQGFLFTLFLSIRSGLVKYNLWQVVLELILIFFAIFPLSLKIETIWLLVNLLGIGGLILFYRLFSTKKYFLNLRQKFGTIASHREKLGLQATIGDDLRALIIGWIPKTYFQKNVKFLAPSVVFFLIWLSFLTVLLLKGNQLTLTILYLLFGLMPPFVIAVAIVGSLKKNRLIRKSKRICHWVSFQKLISNIFNYINSLIPFTTKTTKILLVIDDLDRCEYAQMLNVIESLKLLLEDSELHQRVQVIFLVEEDKLRYAIFKRFEDFLHLKSSRKGEDTSISDQLINDHIEKLITCYLRLPDLTSPETKTLLEKILGYEPLIVEDKSRESNSQSAPIEAEDFERSIEGYYAKILYTLEEKNRIFENSSKMENWTPRQIRQFLFKYQLARLIAVKIFRPVQLPNLLFC